MNRRQQKKKHEIHLVRLECETRVKTLKFKSNVFRWKDLNKNRRRDVKSATAADKSFNYDSLPIIRADVATTGAVTAIDVPVVYGEDIQKTCAQITKTARKMTPPERLYSEAIYDAADSDTQQEMQRLSWVANNPFSDYNERADAKNTLAAIVELINNPSVLTDEEKEAKREARRLKAREFFKAINTPSVPKELTYEETKQLIREGKMRPPNGRAYFFDCGYPRDKFSMEDYDRMLRELSDEKLYKVTENVTKAGKEVYHRSKYWLHKGRACVEYSFYAPDGHQICSIIKRSLAVCRRHLQEFRQDIAIYNQCVQGNIE